MDSFSFSKSLLSYMEQYEEIGMLRKRELIKGTLGIFSDFIYDLYVPSSWHLSDIERIDHHILVFH